MIKKKILKFINYNNFSSILKKSKTSMKRDKTVRVCACAISQSFYFSRKLNKN